MKYLPLGLGLTALAMIVIGSARGANLSVSFSDIPAGSVVDLTAQGAVDWVHWGLITESTVTRKAAVTPRIGDFEPVQSPPGYTYVYQFADNWNGYSWIDGTPTATATNTTTGVWAYSTPPSGSGFQFQVSASTNMQTLRVYAGAYAGRGRFVAYLSDGSAPAFTNSVNSSINNLANGPSGVYTINFSAGSTGHTLHVVYTLQTQYRPDANVTLQAAALTAPDANNPPFVTVTTPTEATSVVTPTNLVLSATANDSDGSVTLVEFFSGEEKLGEATGPDYSIIWTNPPSGRHTITARAIDNNAVASTSAGVTVFVAGNGGGIAGTRAVPATAIDLTVEGSADWAHWGLLDATSFNQKATGGGQIPGLTLLGTNAATRFSNSGTACSWSDGIPVLSTGPSTSGIYVTGLYNGFELIAPADTYPRTLRVYAGLYGAQGNFQAWLSDFSAAAFTDTTLSNVYGSSYVVYTVNYHAATNGQRLTIRFVSSALFDFDYGNVNWQAATLQGEPPPEPLKIRDPAQTAEGQVVFSFSTELGRAYAVEFSADVPASGWNVLTNVTGTGGTLSVTDAVNPGSQRFYRVRAE